MGGYWSKARPKTVDTCVHDLSWDDTVRCPSYVAVKKRLANYGPAGFQTKKWESVGWQK